MNTVIYHNPRCSKSRAALQLLQDRKIEPKIIEYLLTPPSVIELKTILEHLNISARELLRANEPEYSAAGLDNPTLSDDQIIEAIVEHPILLQRPIVVRDNRAAIGRPPENIVSIL